LQLSGSVSRPHASSDTSYRPGSGGTGDEAGDECKPRQNSVCHPARTGYERAFGFRLFRL
jgi:hypothetical protein